MTEYERRKHAKYIVDCLNRYGNVAVVVHPDIVFKWPELAGWKLTTWWPIDDNDVYAEPGGPIPKCKNRKKKEGWWAVWAERA